MNNYKMEALTYSPAAHSAPEKLVLPECEELSLLDLLPGDIFYYRDASDDYYHVLVFFNKDTIQLYSLTPTAVLVKIVKVAEMLSLLPIRGGVFIRRLPRSALHFGGIEKRLKEDLFTNLSPFEEANLDQVALYVITGLGFRETQGTYLDEAEVPTDMGFRGYILSDQDSKIFEFTR